MLRRLRRHEAGCNPGFGRLAGAILALAMVSLVYGCGGPAPGKAPRYLGFWESTFRNINSGGNSLDLRPDSTAQRFYVTMQDFTYRVSSDTLYARPVVADSLGIPADSVPELVFTYEFLGDTLHRQGGGRDLWLVRSEPAPEPGDPFVGVWLLVRSNSAMTVRSYERYDADGSLHVRLPVGTMAGRYQADADSLTLYFPDQDPIPLAWQVRGDTLEIADTRGYTYTYLMSGDHGWYPMLEE